MNAWDTSAVTDMSGLFQNYKGLNEDDFTDDISNWDTSQVTNMAGMFYGAATFNLNIGAWDTSQVTNMGEMSRGALLTSVSEA